jgi:hypothetical protein
VLDVAHTKGLIALTALFLLSLAVFRDAIQVYLRERQSRLIQGMALGVLAGLVGLVAHGINESVLSQTNLEALFWFLLGVAIALKRYRSTNEQNSV